MEVKDLYYIAALLSLLIGGIVTIVVTFQNMKGKLDLLAMDLAHHKLNHERLQKQADDHETNVNIKLEKIDAKIDEVKDMLLGLKG